MNILYLINYAGKAGTEKYVLNLMHILSAQGETCHLAYNVPGQLSETVSSEGFACFRFEMSTKRRSRRQRSLQAIAARTRSTLSTRSTPWKTSSPSCPGFSTAR